MNLKLINELIQQALYTPDRDTNAFDSLVAENKCRLITTDESDDWGEEKSGGEGYKYIYIQMYESPNITLKIHLIDDSYGDNREVSSIEFCSTADIALNLNIKFNKLPIPIND